jgi:microsomal dipeptidase-like Zn-dependent dipeptidase
LPTHRRRPAAGARLGTAARRGEPVSVRRLEQLPEGGVRLQVCAAYEAPQTERAAAFREVLRQIASFHTAVDSNSEIFAVSNRRDVGRVGRDGLGLLLAIEGVSSRLPCLLDALRAHGYSEADVDCIAGGNLVRFLVASPLL